MGDLTGSPVFAAAVGIFSAILGTLVPLWSLNRVRRGRRVSIIVGVIAMMVPLGLMMFFSVMASVFLGSNFITYGISMVVTFLVLMSLGALITWKAVGTVSVRDGEGTVDEPVW